MYKLQLSLPKALIYRSYGFLNVISQIKGILQPI